MFEHDLFQLNASVTNALKSIKGLKSLFGGLQQYEHIAKLRDLEKQLQTVEQALPYYPYPIPSQFLKPGGELYFRQLFTYAALNCWNVPDIFIDAFKARKSKLDDSMEFRDENTSHLAGINQKLADVESRAIAFLNFLNDLITVKGLTDVLNELTTGNALIKCYTNNSRYACSNSSFDHRKPFYLFKLPVAVLMDCYTTYYEANKTDDTLNNDFLGQLPLSFGNEKIAYLFFTIANEGLLAWEDFLNVDRVELVLDVQYRFSAGE